MQKAQNTLDIWWRSANPWMRAAGVWLVIFVLASFITLVVTGAIWDLLFAVLCIVVPSVTILSLIYVTEALIKANKTRRKQDRVAAAYGYKQFDFVKDEGH